MASVTGGGQSYRLRTTAQAGRSTPLLSCCFVHSLVALPTGPPWAQPLTNMPVSSRRPGPCAHAHSPRGPFHWALGLFIHVHASFHSDLSGAQCQLVAGYNGGQRTRPALGSLEPICHLTMSSLGSQDTGLTHGSTTSWKKGPQPSLSL